MHAGTYIHIKIFYGLLFNIVKYTLENNSHIKRSRKCYVVIVSFFLKAFIFLRSALTFRT